MSLPSEWLDALQDFQTDLTAQKRSPQTVRRVARQVRRWGRESALRTPWAAETAQLRDWLECLPVSASVGYTYRTSVRTFYRWAAATGRMANDPTEALGSRRAVRQPAPPAWEEAIQEFQRFLRAANRPATTIRTRTEQLTHLGRTIHHDDPWQVTPSDLVSWLARHGWGREARRRRRAGRPAMASS